MKIVLVSKCSLDIEQYVEFEMSVLISPSKSLISLRGVTNKNTTCNPIPVNEAFCSKIHLKVM